MKKVITIGQDLVVSRIGLGTNRMHNDETSKQVLKKAVEFGINFIDSASAYSNGESEEVIGKFLAPYDNIVVATKGGMIRPYFHTDARSQILEKWLTVSLEKLKL